MEKLGIPTVVIQRTETMGASRQAVMGQGLPPEVPWVVFPVDLFLNESDLTPLSEKLGEIEGMLTTWKPEHTETGTINKEPVVIVGKNYGEAYDKAQYFALTSTWSDGLPITPPTPERVEWILTGTEHRKDELVFADGKVAPKSSILTYEVLATCMAMAGGRPEYMPVADAVCKSIIESQSTMLTSSGGAYQGVLVNGPIKKDIRLTSEWSLFGPDPKHPAGSALGRAISLVIQNVGGHVAGEGTIAQFGENRHTGLCFAEDEEGLPEGWKTFAEEYYDRPKGTNSASAFYVFYGGLSPFVHRGPGDDPSFEIEMDESFLRAREVMKSVGTSSYKESKGSAGMLFYNSFICNNMANIGWTKEKIQQRFAEIMYVLKEELADRTDVIRAMEKEGVKFEDLPDRIPMMTDPTNVHIVCAGGDHASCAQWLGGMRKWGNYEIELPGNWDALIAKSEEDLGPNPDA